LNRRVSPNLLSESPKCLDEESHRRLECRNLALTALAVAIVIGVAAPAHAYIGPGAGFAIGTTLVTFFAAFFSAFMALLSWPFRLTIRAIRRRRAHAKARIKRFVVLGLDGMEPTLVEQYMAEGKLPNFTKLREQGCYMPLGTTAPPLSPVAWSSFLTGSNPGKHNTFDFLTRDKKTYLPQLSSVSINGPRKVLKLGKWRIPLSKPDIRLLRKGKPFWNTLSEHGIFSNIIRVPITFPPEPFKGVLLSAMCVPDLRGTQGTFSFYTTRDAGEIEHIGGEQIHVKRQGNVVRSELIGPENSLVEDGGVLKCPFEIEITGDDTARMKMNGEVVDLNTGVYTDWLTVQFKAGMGVKVSGIAQFLLMRTEPHFELYVTPINIDPGKPALPISHPPVYSTYLAKSQGPFATLGLAEDSWGLNAKILGDDDFLHQAIEADEEREVMFFDALDKVKEGVVVCVFDGTDRIQHMFWRYIDPKHPAREGQSEQQHRNAIEELYEWNDRLLGKTMEECKQKDTVLMVLSDHGFKSFRRGIDLNVWLEENGYLTLQEGGRGKKYLTGVDWSKTKAFALGLAGIWLNVKGREGQGIVEPSDADALRDEICEKLSGLRDEAHDEVAVNKAFNTRKIYRGPYKEEAPDILVGYNDGYRVSWEAAVGEITDQVFHDNMKAWSGDHCIDPRIVPGVLFCNRKIKSEQPRLMDIGPTALDLFGVKVPESMDGKPLEVADANGSKRDTDRDQSRDHDEKGNEQAEETTEERVPVEAEERVSVEA
jgi:predicted AlkP superfamily phosphohydrolase/phosphomutase